MEVSWMKVNNKNVTIILSHLFLLLLIIKEWRKERVLPLLIGRGLSRESLVSSFFVWSPPPYILDLANGSRVSIHRSLSIPIPIQFRLWCGWQTITSTNTITTGVVVSSQPWSQWSQLLLPVVSVAGGDVMAGDIANATTASNDDTSIVIWSGNTPLRPISSSSLLVQQYVLLLCEIDTNTHKMGSQCNEYSSKSHSSTIRIRIGNDSMLDIHSCTVTITVKWCFSSFLPCW